MSKVPITHDLEVSKKGELTGFENHGEAVCPKEEINREGLIFDPENISPEDSKDGTKEAE